MANAGHAPASITFSPLFDAQQVILFAGSERAITNSVPIIGPGADLLTIDASGGTNGVIGNGDGFRIFNIDNGENRTRTAAASLIGGTWQ